MIQVNGLKKNFETFCALDGVDMHVKRGAIYGLVGPNGAGKSTLIRHLTGIYRGDAGEVLIDGEPVYENKNVIKLKIRSSLLLLIYVFNILLLNLLEALHNLILYFLIYF